ncbi:MAG: dihydrolipoamide acetyltransferase family protein [Candidatus Dormibacteria bacterium]
MAEFRLPDLGEGVTEGEMVEWRVREGDTVSRDQVLGVVGTDKATVEIPSPFAGRVEAVLVAEGAKIRVGDPLLRVGGEEAPVTALEAPPVEPMPRPPAALPVEPAPSRVGALPAVRHVARQRGIDLEEVPGSGPGGRVRMSDLERSGEGRRVPLRGAARVMAEQVAEARHHVPQVTVVLELDVEPLEAELAKAVAGSGAVPTLLGLICRGVLAELTEAPIFNASLDESALELVYHPKVQLGIAVQTAEGLRVATIRDADQLSGAEFHEELRRVVDAARSGTLFAADLRGSTFTVSSGGRLGALLATPLVNWPNLAILGVHAIQERAVVRDGQVVVGRRANLSLSFDHRVIDGMTASQFLYRLVERLSGPA